MKWGKYLSENMITEWKEYYVQYKSLKKFISMSELNHSDMDEQFFIQKVEQQVQMIERWFVHVRNECLENFEKVKQNLPKNIKDNLPCLEGYTSFPVSSQSMRDEIMQQFKRANVDSSIIPTLAISSNSDININNNINNNDENENMNDENDNVASNITHTTVNVGVIEEQTVNNNNSNDKNDSNNNNGNKDRAKLLLDNEENDNYMGDIINEEDNDGFDDSDIDQEFELMPQDTKNELIKPIYYESSHTHTHSQTQSAHTTNTRSTVPSEKFLKQERDFIDDFAKLDENGFPMIKPPISVYNDYQLFSHLPGSEHKQCLVILVTLGRLKLFGWQNSEGLRKIIKKFDKRFGCSLTQTLWPKIKLTEFVQEIKTDSYIAQVAAVLCTRRIPCAYFDANDLREQGVNLRQMATAIQQLKSVVDRNLPEVIPMNVEPRSYMANERTWLKWMRMAAFTTLVGMILISLGHEPVTGIILVLLSIAVMCRSYFEYNMRNRCLVQRKEHEWIDHLGPKLLLLSFLLPCVTYIAYLIYFKNTKIIFHK